MSKKCIKCGEILPDDASFCPHCTTVQTEKKEIKAPRKWRKKAVIGVAVSYTHLTLPTILRV